MICPIHRIRCKTIKEKIGGCPQSYGNDHENKCQLEWLRNHALKFQDLATFILDVINLTEPPNDPYK